MLNRLTTFELKYHLKQGGFWAATFCFIWMAVLITSQRGSMFLYANSAYAITQTMLYISPNIIFVLCVLASATLLRDSQYKMEPLIFTTPIDKFQYLASRYLGIVFAAVILLLMVVLAMMVTLLFIDDQILGPFQLGYYFLSYSIFILPTILLCSSVVFATAMLSKNMIAVYVSGIVIYVIYIMGSILGNSPLIAGSSSLLSEGTGFSALLEPYGLIAFMDQSAFWTSEERNTFTPVLAGNLLFNRLLWLTVSVSLFVFTYKKFSFRAVNESAKKLKLSDDNEQTRAEKAIYKTAESIKNFDRLNYAVWLSKFKLEYLTATKGKAFIVLLCTTMLFTLGNLMGNIFDGPVSNGQPYYPHTEMILELLRQPLSDIGMLVAVFYSVELYWNERIVKISSLIDVTPTQNLTFYLAKIVTVLMVCFTLVLSSIVIAIAFQFSQGMFDIQPWLYSILFYYAGVPMLLTAFLVFSLQRLAKTKALGLLLGISTLLLSVFVKNIGLDHPLTIFAFRPQFIFSDMANTIYHDDAVHWYNLYWLSFGAILALLTVKFWQRGSSNISQKLTLSGRILLTSFVLVFVSSGSYIYYQTNIFNQYFTEEQQLQMMEDYERQYVQYKNMPQPTVTDIKVDVDIFPKLRKYNARGRYFIVNQTDKPMEKLIVSVLNQSHIEQNIEIPKAKLEKYDARYQTYFYQLNKPMMPGEQRTLNFEFSVTHNAFAELDGEHYVTKGGAYIELEDIMPQFGYVENYVIDDEEERQKRGLPLVKLSAPTAQTKLVSDNWVNFETVVSTIKEQKVVTVGRLQKNWLKDGRNYFHYKSDNKVRRQLAYTSAEFDHITEVHNGVELTIYHSPEHNKDTELMFDALKQTMDYFAANYHPYHSNQFSVVELPYFSSAKSFGSAQPGMYVGVENRFFNLDNSDVISGEYNPLLSGVSHEFAHQYWGYYIEPNYIGGYALLTEVLSEYTELVMARQLYGEYAVNIDVNQSIDRYLRGRPYSTNIEKPLYSIGMEPHVYYDKGKQTMHALLDLLGEENINKALKSLLENHGYPKKPTSLDLLNEFYKVANDSQIVMINELFKRVVFHEFTIHNAKSVQLANGDYETTIDVSTLKLVLNQQNNKEEKETINDSIDIAFYSGFPAVDNENMTLIKKVKFNQDRTKVVIASKEKPNYVKIDPNRLRIDRSLVNNVLEVE